MTKRERVIAALNHRETDFIPYTVGFTEEEHKKVAAYLNDPNFNKKIANHIDGCYYSGFSEGLAHAVEGKPGYIADDFGVVWNRSGPDKDIGVIEGCVMPEPDMKYYLAPKLDFNKLMHTWKAQIENGSGAFKEAGVGFTMFERAWTIRGMENLLSDMALTPGFVHDLMDAICDFNIEIIDEMLTLDIDGFHFGDDWGQQRKLIMGPGHWRVFIKPRMARMIGRAKKAGKSVSLHSCGDISDVFDDLIEIGLDCYQTFQPEIYDIKKIKQTYGKDLSFWGGMSTQQMLPFETPDGVKQKCTEIMRVMKPGGGFIAAPTHSMPADIPPENVVAMLEVFENQDRYL